MLQLTIECHMMVAYTLYGLPLQFILYVNLMKSVEYCEWLFYVYNNSIVCLYRVAVTITYLNAQLRACSVPCHGFSAFISFKAQSDQWPKSQRFNLIGIFLKELGSTRGSIKFQFVAWKQQAKLAFMYHSLLWFSIFLFNYI